MHTAVTFQLPMDTDPSLGALMAQLVATNALVVKMQSTLDELQKDVNAMKNATFSSSSSGRRLPCPLGCGNDFKKVCRIWRCLVALPCIISSQATYLLDHLYRSTKISKRSTVVVATRQECVFNIKKLSHQALWTSVFAEPTVANDQNVHPSCCAIISPLTFLQKRHWCTAIACRASAEATASSPQLHAQPGIDIATVATAGDHLSDAATFSEQLRPGIGIRGESGLTAGDHLSDAATFSEQLGPGIGIRGESGFAPSFFDMVPNESMFLCDGIDDD
jgi:hypothetical protein